MGDVIYAEHRFKRKTTVVPMVKKWVLSTKMDVAEGRVYVRLEGSTDRHGFVKVNPRRSDRHNHRNAAQAFAEAMAGPKTTVTLVKTTGGDITTSGLRYHYAQVTHQ